MTLSPSEVHTVVIGALLALFLSALDQTIISTALPTMAAELGDFALISWVVTSYLLVSTCVTPILGKLSDLYGRRVILLICLVVFLGASALCALAPTMPLLIAARAIQGAGGGGLMVMAQTIIADVVAPRERGRYAAYFAMVWASSSLIGPILGGFLSQHAGWPWIFWVNLPIGLVAFFVIDRVLRKLPVRHQPTRIDYLSVTLFTLASTGVLAVLSLGGTQLKWSSPWLWGIAAAAVVIGWLFLRRQGRVAEPILPPRFLTDAVVGPALGAVALGFGAYLAIAVLAPTYMQVALGAEPATVGLMMIPMMIATTITAASAGRYVKATGNYKLPPLIGMPVAAGALIVLALLGQHDTLVIAAGLLFLVGLGIGPIFPTSMVAAQNAVARRDLGTITGTIGFSRALGGAVLTAAASALVLGLIALWVPAAGNVAGMEDLVRHPLDAAGRAEIARAFSVLFGATAAVILIAAFIYMQVAHRPLRESVEVEPAEPI
ncbi:MAG: MDR family MFS transporter [Ferrovibrionaceae bacterium]